MSASGLKTAFQNGVDILNTIVSSATGMILAFTGDVNASKPDADNVEWWQHVGFLSRPSKAVPGKQAAQGFVIRQGNRDACIASKDVRGQKLAGTLGYGETCMYGPGADGGSQGRMVCKDSGAVAIFTTKGNVEGGTGVSIQANPDGSIVLASEYGAFYIGPDGVKLIDASGAALQMTGGNVTLIGTALALNGGSVSLGANASQPALWGPTGVAGAASTSVKIAI